LRQVRDGDAGGTVTDDPNRTVAPTSAVREAAAVVPQEAAVGASGDRSSPGHASAEPPPGTASIVLRVPDQDDVAEPVKLEVAPGARVALLAMVRNQSSVVDNYDIEVSGLPEDWWTASPPTAYLVPFGRSGTYEQEIQIDLHPPKSAEAVARPWSLEVVAYSRAYGRRVAAAPATVVITPYQQLACELRPERASGKLKARFALTVRNRANSAVDVRVDGTDADGECRFRFAEPSITVRPGQAIEAPFTVFPPRQIWLGRATERRLQLSATPVDSAGSPPPASCPAVFRQRAWLPWWLAIVAPLAIIALTLAILLLPKQVKVPDVRKATVFEAQKRLNGAGLNLSPIPPQHVPAAGLAPGTIVDQTPRPGVHVRKGSLVTVVLAEGSGSDTVPSVVGSTPAQADSLLRAAGLTLGTISPQPPDPKGTIATQIPEANQNVSSGTAVAVFLTPSSSTKAPQHPKIPSPGGTPTAVAAQLAQAGLVPVVTRAISTRPAGEVIETNPPAGSVPKPGSKVQIVESLGFPELTYDSEGFVHFVSGANGAPAPGLPTSLRGEEAAWSADGTRVVFRQGGQLFILPLNKGSSAPQPLTAPGSNAHDPAFAPTLTSHVLAYVEVRNGTSELCISYVGASLLAPQCTGHPGWELGHQVAWSPDGRSILVTGVEAGHQGTFGLIDFTSRVPFSTHNADWGHGALVTPASHEGEGVIAGALSPDGKQLALVGDFAASGFNVYLTKPSDFKLQQARRLHISACQLSWRSDSQALAVLHTDTQCSQTSTGQIVGTVETFSLADPAATTQIFTPASHPAWEPLALNG
jgi:beta-lactam-binding protein with PASTA domain